MRNLVTLSTLAGLASAGTITVDVHKQLAAELSDILKVHRRSGDPIVDLQAINNVTGGGYYADLGIGTPQQVLTFHLDTGSSDTWVNLKGNDFCRNGRPELGLPPSCMKQFDPTASSTYQTAIRGGFKISYLDGSTASGDYFNDTVTVGNNFTITQQQLGLARTSGSATGLMGLGMSVGVAARKEYPTVIDNLVSHGVIETAAFSLYLDSITESHGSFLFGGIDTKKYIGDLTTLPLVADDIHGSENVTSYAVNLLGVSADGITIPSLKTKAILDTGATLVLLPGRIVKPIYSKLGVVSVTDVATPFIDCAAASKQDSKFKFNFQFNGKTISVPLKEMIINSFADHQDLFKSTTLRSLFKNMDKVCMFGIASADDYKTQEPDPFSTGGSSANQPEYALLGDTFLRSAYVVYDLERKELALAQAYPKSNESNVVVLKANSPIPSIKGMDAPSEEESTKKDSAAGIARAPSAAAAAALALVAAAVAAL
ncbi:candidapepsin-4 precursor [Cordyceps fumosorosea ARSEF 2679]|uniref:Candidapepsin-4 n=1 Tax=Cordyceps fumosorosea (strain ARSEF 2679) TaxID=1081104 RepID=A0A167ZKE7_CORFA|nr:candidapepsin-4 precursor [Cordyceps fumosorosea ARSEF 2679]OAA67621.1 candidapepsin-4 precursor [Cordyceps fumosorosea ARSEF 2679]